MRFYINIKKNKNTLSNKFLHIQKRNQSTQQDPKSDKNTAKKTIFQRHGSFIIPIFVTLLYVSAIAIKIYFFEMPIDLKQIAFDYETVILISIWLYCLYARNIEKNIYPKTFFLTFLVEVFDYSMLTWVL